MLHRVTGRGSKLSLIPPDQIASTGPALYLMSRFCGNCECSITFANSLLIIMLQDR